jgi:predicted nucleic acid-binding protein
VTAVISDASPVIALAFLGLEALLHSLFAEVLIPSAVAAEVRQPRGVFGGIDCSAIPGLRVLDPTSSAPLSHRHGMLDPGERAAIALAVEHRNSLLIIDERRGREVARELGVRVTGTVGILLRAKQNALIASVRPLLDRLRRDLDFFLSQELYDQAVRLAGEG